MYVSNIYWLTTDESGPVLSYKSRYIVGCGLVEMTISTNPKPTIYCNLYENTCPGGSGNIICLHTTATENLANLHPESDMDETSQ